MRMGMGRAASCGRCRGRRRWGCRSTRRELRRRRVPDGAGDEVRGDHHRPRGLADQTTVDVAQHRREGVAMSGRTRVASAAVCTRAWSTPSSVETRSAMPRARSARRSGFCRAASAIVVVFAVSKAVCCTHHADRASDALSKPRVRKIVPRARRTRRSMAVGPVSVRSSRGSGTGPHDVWPMIGRALLRRCPRCGGKGWFRGWFTKVERCRTCGYRYERQPGFLLGALTINTIVTFGLLAAVLLVGSILSYPDIAVGPMLIAAGRGGGGGAHRLLPLLLHDLGRRRPHHASAGRRRAGRCRRPRRSATPPAARSGRGA